MKLARVNMKIQDLSDCFANFFDNKAKKIAETCKVDDNVYNGSHKVNCTMATL